MFIIAVTCIIYFVIVIHLKPRTYLRNIAAVMVCKYILHSVLEYFHTFTSIHSNFLTNVFIADGGDATKTTA